MQGCRLTGCEPALTPLASLTPAEGSELHQHQRAEGQGVGEETAEQDRGAKRTTLTLWQHCPKPDEAAEDGGLHRQPTGLSEQLHASTDI